MDREVSTGPLPHRLILLTGPTGSGKIMVRDMLVSLLNRLAHKTRTLTCTSDICEQLASGVEPSLEHHKCSIPTTGVIDRRLAEYCSGNGARFLLQLLASQSPEQVLIVDAPIDAADIKMLKHHVQHFLVIGVYAPAISKHGRGTQLDMIGQHKPRFDANAAFAEAQIVIETDCALPFRIQMMLLEVLQQQRFVPSIWRAYEPVQPMRKASSTQDPRLLKREDFRDALDEFALKAHGSNVVVVQGGNRFASHYLRTKYGIEVTDVKLSGLDKQHPSVLLETMLTAQERITTVATDGSLLTEVLQSLPSRAIPVPRHAKNARRVRREFAMYQDIIAQESPLDHLEETAQTALFRTQIRRRLAADHKPIVFLDDIIYRGRVLHSAWYTLRMLGLLDRPWQLTVMCVDRSSRALRSRYFEVLRPGLVYPYESCARSAQGYYDLASSRFEYRDLSQLRPALARLYPNVVERSPVDTEWSRLLSRSSQLLGAPKALTTVADAIVTIVVHQHTLAIDQPSISNALALQRSVGLGWCPPFLSFWDSFISEDQPVRSRARFERAVRRLCIRACEKIDTPILLDLADMYKEIHVRLWYNNECLV